MLFLLMVVCYIDRCSMSILIIPMGEELGWSAHERSIVMSSFFVGYASTQIFAGFLATMYGGKKVLLVGCGLWALFTFLSIGFASHNILLLVISRTFVGCAEACVYPVSYHVINAWVPKVERSRASSAMLAGACVGTVCGLILVPHIIEAYSWKHPIYFSAITGAVWVALWAAVVRDDHNLSSAPAAEEVQMDTLASESKDSSGDAPEEQEMSVDMSKTKSKITLRTFTTFLTYMPCVAIFVGHFCVNWGQYVILMWAPTYFVHQFDVDLKQAGTFTVVPYIVKLCGSIVSAQLADQAVASGVSLVTIRKTFHAIACLGSAGALILLSESDNPQTGVRWLSVALGLLSMTSAGHRYCFREIFFWILF